MDDLTIRRNRSFAVPQRQGTGKAEKQSAAGETQKVSKETGITVSRTLEQLMSRAAQAADRSGESRRTLQLGEGVLAEVQEKLDRMAELAKEAGREGGVDREALQAELEKLVEEIDRMTGSAVVGNLLLFSEGDSAGAAALLRALAGGSGTPSETALPDWLVKAAVQGGMTPEKLLAALGLDRSASGSEILAAIAGSSLESNSAAGYLAALYLGAVIAGGAQSGELDPTKALDGLRQLLEKAADGVPLDQAIAELTGGEFTGLEDFQTQFLGGTIPGMEKFLTNLLLPESSPFEGADLLRLMAAGPGGMELDLMLALLSAGQAQQLPAGGSAASAAAVPPEGSAGTVPADGSAAARSAAAQGTAGAENPPQPALTAQYGALRVMGRDLSGVSYDPGTGELTVDGPADIVLQGAGRTAPSIQLHGSGTVTLQSVRAAVLTAAAPEVRIVTAGENLLERVVLGEGTALTLDGRGMLRTGGVQDGGGNVLRLLGGAVAVAERGASGEEVPGVLTVPVVMDGPVSLAARAASVRDLSGRTLEPMDVVWKALFPGFDQVASLTVDGRHGKMLLMSGEHSALARLWLAKGDPSSQGYPAHSLVIRGRDEAGRPRTRYAYLRWDRRAGMFREASMYPNPFTVTGGEKDRDWIYEEESHTLHILTGQVTAVSGGAGTDARQAPFSGRIALMDQIGPVRLALGGVVCKVSSGRAFQLGRENDVTLVLRGGTHNLFESGAGCAGISMGAGTSLRIDCTQPGKGGETAGMLTATGGEGSVGIGGDGGGSRSGHIMIRGGMVAGGAKPGDAGSVTIVGSANAGGTDLGNARTWARMGIFLQMGEDTVILPQFPLSSRALQLNKLRVTTREYARAARMTIDADRRWVEQIQTAYNGLSNRLERSVSGLNSVRRPGADLVRDTPAADALLRGMRQSIPLQSSQAIETHSKRGTEDVGQLLR